MPDVPRFEARTVSWTLVLFGDPFLQDFLAIKGEPLSTIRRGLMGETFLTCFKGVWELDFRMPGPRILNFLNGDGERTTTLLVTRCAGLLNTSLDGLA